MYRTIYVPVDNSDYSNAAIDLALTLGRQFGSNLVGSHVYAAKLHDVRFKQMEFTLPDEYKEETELEKQRKIHDALIGRGLHLISDSYLDQMSVRAGEAQLGFERKHFDGKNFEAIVRDVSESGYDLVVLGALGQGAVKDSLVGSVVERLLRRTEVDTLVVRNLECSQAAATDASGRITVSFDGSAHSWAGLVSACRLAKSLGKTVEILAAVPASASSYDRMLQGAHLTAAERYARSTDVSVAAEVFDCGTEENPGEQPRDAILRRVRDLPPWLLVVGRAGADTLEDQAQAIIGSTTEHLVRHAPCNVLVSSRKAEPASLSA